MEPHRLQLLAGVGAVMVATSAATILGGRYRLDALVARGGTSEVWRGTDLTMGRVVAVKVAVAMEAPTLEHEAGILGEVGDGDAPACFDFGTDGVRAYLVMEYLEGANLAQIGPGAPAEARAAWTEAARDALARLHARGVTHGDVKPSHLVVSPEGRVRFVDFGSALYGEALPPVARATEAYRAAHLPPGPEADRFALERTVAECWVADRR